MNKEKIDLQIMVENTAGFLYFQTVLSKYFTCICGETKAL
jgi:hypothetical protein